jgi:hypothetical protein
MQTPKPSKPILNVLVLAALIGTVLFGWLSGHILRYSIPAFWHPPIQETDPHIKNGYQFEFESERILLTPQESLLVRVYISGIQLDTSQQCPGFTYPVDHEMAGSSPKIMGAGERPLP